jgi:hypothetical protein
MARVRAANLRYLSDWAWLTYEHVRTLSSMCGDLSTATAGADAQATVPQPPAPSLVLEAESGRQARGVFLVENTLPRSVHGKIQISAFADAQGNEVHPRMTLEPSEVVLEPGAEVLVHVLLDMDDSIPPSVRFVGRLTVPGLSNTPIEVVLKRRPSAHRPEEASEPVIVATRRSRPRTKKTASRKKSLARKSAT